MRHQSRYTAAVPTGVKVFGSANPVSDEPETDCTVLEMKRNMAEKSLGEARLSKRQVGMRAVGMWRCLVLLHAGSMAKGNSLRTQGQYH